MLYRFANVKISLWGSRLFWGAGGFGWNYLLSLMAWSCQVNVSNFATLDSTIFA